MAAAVAAALDDTIPQRYTFWPRHRDALPFLEFAARGILGAQLTSMGIEGFHSVCGFINNKHRNRLKPETIERYALAREILMKTLKEDPVIMSLRKDVHVEEDDALGLSVMGEWD